MSGRNGKNSKGAANAAPDPASPVSGPNGPHTRPPVRTRLIGYCRVSTAGQADNGISILEQIHRIDGYARAHGHELVAIEQDRGRSGKDLGREALRAALGRLRTGEADGLVVVKLDRLSRDVRDTLNLADQFQSNGWQLHSIQDQIDTESINGRLFLTILSGMAEWERGKIAERTRDALAELRRGGRRISGKPPFGFRFEGGEVVQAPEEQETLERLLELRADGMGARTIARRLAAEGIRNPRTGRDWNPSTLANILRRLEREGA